MARLQVEDLSKRFGERWALRHVTFRTEGEVLGLVGPNGAGKTTTLRLLATLLEPTGGHITIDGQRDPRRVRAQLGFLPENPGFYEALTARRNLEYHARLQGTRLDESMADSFGLAGRLDEPVRAYSKGMRQRLALLRALVHRPPILLFDEPTAHLDVDGRRAVQEALRGRTAVVTSHHLEEIERLCHRVAILSTKLVAIGTPEEMKAALARRGRVRLHLPAAPRERTEQALRGLPGLRGVEWDGPEAIVELESPIEQTPEMVERLVKAGIPVAEVRRERPSLEDAYTELLKRRP